jgi:putative ABC transport system permease protein
VGPGEGPAGRPSRAIAVASLLAAALLGLLLLRAAPLPVVAAIFAAAAGAAALAFLGLGRALAWAAGRLARGRRGLSLRLALGNLHRPGAPTATLAMAMGLGATLLVTVAVARANLDRHLAATLPASAPDLVLLNLAPADGPRLDAALAALPGIARWQRAPFLHAPVIRIAGEPVAARRVPAELGFVIRGDRGVSWRATPPPGGLVAGAWWPAGYAGPPLAALDAGVARRLGLGVGDRLTLVLAGTPTEVHIAGLREMDWAGLGLDTPILLSPPPVPPPHREVAALWLAPGAEAAAVRAALARAFPEAPAIAVEEVIATLAAAANAAGAGLSAAASATGVAALIVLAGAVAATRARRLREAVVLKLLGATRGQVLLATLLEFALLGTACAAVAMALGTLAAWALVGPFIGFHPAPLAALPWAASCVAAMAAAALAAAARALAPRPATVLRAA